MTTASRCGSAGRWLAGFGGLAAACYGAYASLAWVFYGRTRRPRSTDEFDPLLDRFMPDYEIAERHHIHIAAPVSITYESACGMDLERSPIIRAIFRTREAILGANGSMETRPQGLIEQTKAMGWEVLAEVPGREIVMGAVTQPWTGNVVFRALPPDEFARFHEPGFVKIAWTIRADPDGDFHSMHRTETRAIATDPIARAKFRRYWAAFSAGIVLIRRIGLRIVKKEAERAARQVREEIAARRTVCRIG